MSNVHYFQRYNSRENTHSANACLLLSRLYSYSDELFYDALSSLFEVESASLSTQFVLQEKKKKTGSVPDFSIYQPSFKLVVEAKEKRDGSNEQQLMGHADGLKIESALYKFLVLLAPEFGEKDEKNIKNVKEKYKDLYVTKVTYLDLYKAIKEFLVEYRDDEMIEVLDDYYDYCQEEGLVAGNNNDTIMVRLSGQTLEHNIKYNLYYDSPRTRWSGFGYLGLYTKKSVKYVGKIKTICNCHFSNGELEEEIIFGSKLSAEDRKTITSSFNEEFGLECKKTYTYYLVDRFSKVENFNKTSPRALYGKKKFYLSDYGVSEGASSDEVAKALSNRDW